MKKAQYVIVDSHERFFKEITKQNKILFTKDREQATQMDYSDAEELIPLIELYSGCVAVVETVE